MVHKTAQIDTLKGRIVQNLQKYCWYPLQARGLARYLANTHICRSEWILQKEQKELSFYFHHSTNAWYFLVCRQRPHRGRKRRLDHE